MAENSVPIAVEAKMAGEEGSDVPGNTHRRFQRQKMLAGLVAATLLAGMAGAATPASGLSLPTGGGGSGTSGTGSVTGPAGSVLILAPTVSGGLSSPEAQAAQAAGYGVNVVDGSTWDSMTTSQFAAYSALVLGDPSCGSASDVQAAVANAPTWSAALRGNVVVVGTDPTYHQYYGSNSAGAAAVVQDGIYYALGGAPGRTGAYISLSCYYASAPAQTAVPVLSSIDGGNFTVQGGLSCADWGHVEAGLATRIPAFGNLSDADLASWGCSVHETFDSWPAGFTPLAIDPGATPTNYTGPDGIAGQPYILVNTAAPATVMNYVALGDSYSSGEGNPPFLPGTDGSHDYCHRSAAAYPNILAERYGLDLHFYACSGAGTINILLNKLDTEIPQIKRPALKPGDALVTLTIGGTMPAFLAYSYPAWNSVGKAGRAPSSGPWQHGCTSPRTEVVWPRPTSPLR